VYAIIEIAGRQYRVSPDDQIQVDRLHLEPGARLSVDRVMLVGDGDRVEVGAPFVPYRVDMEVVSHDRHPKVISYHFKRRGGMRRTIGHRQRYTVVKVKSIRKGDE